MFANRSRVIGAVHITDFLYYFPLKFYNYEDIRQIRRVQVG